MMLGVLVLVKERQESPFCDVLFFGISGLVLVGCLGFLLFLGFAGSVFFLSSFFSCFGVLFVYFPYA